MKSLPLIRLTHIHVLTLDSGTRSTGVAAGHVGGVGPSQHDSKPWLICTEVALGGRH
jgi:hypothetical protein